MILAEVLGSFEEFIGGPSECHHLLPLLDMLCREDETTVREQAVNSINMLGACLSTEQVTKYVAPMVATLGGETEWFTPRVSACGLVALAYKGCHEAGDDAAGDEVLSMFSRLAQEESPMVRRAAASHLGNVCSVLPDAKIREVMAPLYVGLTQESEQVWKEREGREREARGARERGSLAAGPRPDPRPVPRRPPPHPPRHPPLPGLDPRLRDQISRLCPPRDGPHLLRRRRPLRLADRRQVVARALGRLRVAARRDGGAGIEGGPHRGRAHLRGPAQRQ